MMAVGIKKTKKNPAAKTSVDINPDCHIFIGAAKYSEKKIGLGNASATTINNK